MNTEDIEKDFCDKCSNKLRISCSYDEKLEYPVLMTICDTCNQKNKYTIDEVLNKRINYTPYTIDYSNNQYGNIIDDNTISYAPNKSCIKCENNYIKQICINVSELKYVFICTKCETQWTTR